MEKKRKTAKNGKQIDGKPTESAQESRKNLNRRWRRRAEPLRSRRRVHVQFNQVKAPASKHNGDSQSSISHPTPKTQPNAIRTRGGRKEKNRIKNKKNKIKKKK